MNSTSRGLWVLPLAAVIGCSSAPKPQPLTPEAFVSPRDTAGANDNPNTGGGAVGDNARPAVQVPDNPVTNTLNKVLGQPAAAHSPSQPRDGGSARASIPDVVANEIKPVGSNGTGRDSAVQANGTTLPAIGVSTGQYLTLGGVVAEVNGVPIYANKVLALNDVIFREKARKLDERNFQRQAIQEIVNTIRQLVREELEYAAALKNLDPDDRRLADNATIGWRMQQITMAGGSLELARRASLVNKENPMDFEERTIAENRAQLIRIYYSKKINPRIQVTAADIRNYYDRNFDKEFTTNDQVEFRLIKVDIEGIANGGNKKKEAALNFTTEKWKRAKAGEDFTKMAMNENTEAMFKGEKPFAIAPKSFSIAPVREALAKLKPGEISEILEDRGAFYIVKLEKRVEGKTQQFEDQVVQEKIRNTLRAEQLHALRERELDKLFKEAAIREEPQMIQIALDMAMQRYHQYAAAK